MLLLLLLAGAGSGFLARLFGPPGGLVMVPLLLAIFASAGVSSLVATHLSLGTALLAYTCVFTAALIRSRADFSRQFSAALFAGGAVGALGGALWGGAMLGSTLQKIYAGIVLLAVLQLIGDMKKAREELPGVSIRLFFTGLAGGVTASWSGGGGEAVYQRSLYSYLGFPLTRSHAMAALAMAGTALFGALGYAVAGRGEQLLPPGSIGYVGVLEALPLVAGFFLLDRPLHLPDKTRLQLRRIYAVVLLIVAAKMFFS
jgi:uncharacterized membrane protein YfcA